MRGERKGARGDENPPDARARAVSAAPPQLEPHPPPPQEEDDPPQDDEDPHEDDPLEHEWDEPLPAHQLLPLPPLLPPLPEPAPEADVTARLTAQIARVTATATTMTRKMIPKTNMMPAPLSRPGLPGGTGSPRPA